MSQQPKRIPAPEPADKPAYIELTHGLFAIVDAWNYAELNKHKWRAVKASYKWYAVRDRPWNEKTYTVKMHRVIAHTPKGMVTHHKNRNSLDNREANLDNQWPDEHKRLHANSRLQVKMLARPGGLAAQEK